MNQTPCHPDSPPIFSVPTPPSPPSLDPLASPPGLPRLLLIRSVHLTPDQFSSTVNLIVSAPSENPYNFISQSERVMKQVAHNQGSSVPKVQLG
jgi:hypothetical protein